MPKHVRLTLMHASGVVVLKRLPWRRRSARFANARSRRVGHTFHEPLASAQMDEVHHFAALLMSRSTRCHGSVLERKMGRGRISVRIWV